MKLQNRKRILASLIITLGILDIVFSVVSGILVGIFAEHCDTENEFIINYNVTLDQIEFFYQTLEDCGYLEESDIPSSETACSHLEQRVQPYFYLSIILNFILGVFMLVLVFEKRLSCRKSETPISKLAKMTLLIIPIGTLFAMFSGIKALMEYDDRNLCWLDYSIYDKRKFETKIIVIVVSSLIIGLYKPFELGVFFFYASSKIQTGKTAKPNHQTPSANLADQLEKPRPVHMREDWQEGQGIFAPADKDKMQ